MPPQEKDVLETRIQKFDSERALVHQERDGMKRRLELLATERDKLVQDIAELRVKYEARSPPSLRARLRSNDGDVLLPSLLAS